MHANWKPVPGRFKDYIALPKANMYQSLHTTVIGPYGERIEVQIRTHEMHRVAEYGIAAHWRYKGGGSGATPTRDSASPGCGSCSSGSSTSRIPQEFLRSVKEDLFSDEVFVFTPKGDLLNFPEGASVIDFAYRIHSEVGHHCAGARVNGRLVPLRYQLHSGDTVEIITTASQTPTQGLAQPRQDDARQGAHPHLGQVPAAPTRRSPSGARSSSATSAATTSTSAKLRKDGRLERLLEELEVADEETLLADVGYGKLTTQQVLARLFPEEELERRREQKEGALQQLFRLVAASRRAACACRGVEDMLVRFGEVLRSAARRAHPRLHHPRPRRHRARRRLPAGAGERPAAAHRRAVGERRGHRPVRYGSR